MTVSLRRKTWILLLAVSLAVTAFPRFNNQDLGPLKSLTGRNAGGTPSLGDAPQYINYVEYFRGEASIDGTVVPFRYRPLAPYIASWLPVHNPMTAINIVNLLSLYIALYFLFRFLRLLGFSFQLAVLGGLMFSVSFPVLYYGTTGCVDAPAMAVIMAGTYLVFREKWVSLLLLIIVGTAIKEMVLLLVPVAFGYLFSRRGRWFLIPAVLTVACAATMIIIRQTVITSGDGYYWIPNIASSLANIRLRAAASIGLTFGIPGVIALGFFRYWSKIISSAGYTNLIPMVCGIAAGFSLVLLSAFTAYTDGRFLWPGTFYLIPIALWVTRDGLLSGSAELEPQKETLPQSAE